MVKTFYTYLKHDKYGNERLRLILIPHCPTTAHSLLCRVGQNIGLNGIKNSHRFTHASAREMFNLLKDAKMTTASTQHYCQKVSSACDICAQSGRPYPKKKISITHVNEAFNQSLQVDFLVVYVNGKKYFVLNIIFVGASHGERCLPENRSASYMIRSLEREWIYHHGAPRFFSSDPEFCNQHLNSFLKCHDIELQTRPSRSSHKNCKVERNNGIFKSVFNKNAVESTTTDVDLLVKRASFVTNLFHGNSILSSSQLARGYSPSVICIPARLVPKK